ncbi:hypothetical protein BLA29_013307 [Euroglyphus maynei]|uniref:Uncharacterized protein n=1 Tax=Euroglyphus maynei TaxID=6958 RepID=A0A1Y3BRR7_EURMA|nr:hypothetical protein BLA29_013307 [Euroglyphus maynei]
MLILELRIILSIDENGCPILFQLMEVLIQLVVK